MLDWFRSRPKPPIDTWHKAWTETRMLWLADQLGGDRLLKAKVLRPVRDDFPDVDARTDDGARRLMEFLCEVMGIEPRKIELEVVEDEQIPGAAGHYDALDSGRTVVRIGRSRLAEFQGLVATLAHELAHELLLGRGLLTTEADDHELVADLLPVFLGLGIFAANSTIFERTRCRPGHSGPAARLSPLPRPGICRSPSSLTCAGEGVPQWSEYLPARRSRGPPRGAEIPREDRRHPLRPGVVAGPIACPGRSGTRRSSTERQRLRTLAALWQIKKDGPAGEEQVDAVLSLLEHRDESLRTEAAWVVGAHSLAPDRAPGLLFDALRSRDGATRATAAWAWEVPRRPRRPSHGSSPSSKIPKTRWS